MIKTQLSDEIRLFSINNVLTEDEIKHLKELTNNRMTKSVTINKNTLKREVSTLRTSYSCYLGLGETEIIKKIEKKLAELVDKSIEYMENLQVVRYKKGEYFNNHYDWFYHDMDEYKSNGQRIITLFLYLSDDFKGGKTYFKSLNKFFKPEKGGGLMWYNIDKEGKEDKKTNHSGTTIIDGIKWGLNVWFREKKFRK